MWVLFHVLLSTMTAYKKTNIFLFLKKEREGRMSFFPLLDSFFDLDKKN